MWYGDLVNLDPTRGWYPLRGESLDVFDGMMGRVDKELADEVHAFVVGDMGSRFLAKRFAIEVLWQSIKMLQCLGRGFVVVDRVRVRSRFQSLSE